MLWQLTSNDMDILKIEASDSGEAEKQLTLLGISMTRRQGTFVVTGQGNYFFLSVHGSFSFANHYVLKLIE